MPSATYASFASGSTASNVFASLSACRIMLRAGKLFFLNDRVVIGFHSIGDRKGEKGARVVRVRFQRCLRHFAGLLIRFKEKWIPILRRFAVHAAEKRVVVQKKFRA